jgi:FkbM family methyltransferase
MGHARGSFSQDGIDRFLLEYFGNKAGTYVDVGANHPFVISNTFLLYKRGWRGLTIEPIVRLTKKHRFWRPRDVCVNVGIDENRSKLILHEFCPAGFSTFDESQAQNLLSGGCFLVRKLEVDVFPLAEIYKTHSQELPSVDLLSVDAEGMDLRILRSNDFTILRPKLIVVERQDEPHGERELEELLAANGYHHFKTYGYNLIFERRTN